MADRPVTAGRAREWANRLGDLVRSMEATGMHDATPVLCAARTAYYVALSTKKAADEPTVPVPALNQNEGPV